MTDVQEIRKLGSRRINVDSLISKLCLTLLLIAFLISIAVIEDRQTIVASYEATSKLQSKDLSFAVNIPSRVRAPVHDYFEQDGISVFHYQWNGLFRVHELILKADENGKYVDSEWTNRFELSRVALALFSLIILVVFVFRISPS